MPQVIDVDDVLEKYYGSRRIFLESCQAAFPYIAEISRENLGQELQGMEDLLVTSCPSLPDLPSRLSQIRIGEKVSSAENDPAAALALIDEISSAMSISIEGTLGEQAARGFSSELQGQLNVCVMQMYRLELFRDDLERDVGRANGKTRPAPAETADLKKERSLEELKQEVAEAYRRIGLERQFNIPLDQWIKEDLARDPNPDIFEEDLAKWRRLEQGIDVIREWFTKLKSDEKAKRYQDLLENLRDVLSGF